MSPDAYNIKVRSHVAAVEGLDRPSTKSTGVTSLDGALAILATAREAQWEAMREFHEAAGVMERAMTKLANCNQETDAAQRALFGHLEITTRPDGEEPPVLTQAGVDWAGNAVAQAKGLFPQDSTVMLPGRAYKRCGLSDAEITYILNADNIMAIKAVRARLRNGLKEAKDMVDKFIQVNNL